MDVLGVVRVVMELTAGAFVGACLYILVAQHPVRMALGGLGAVEDFRSVIPRAEKVQAPLLVVCLVAAGTVLVFDFSLTVAVGGALMLAVLVQTVLTVLPINRRLLSGSAVDHPQAGDALARWGRLHAVRTVVALLGAVALLL